MASRRLATCGRTGNGSLSSQTGLVAVIQAREMQWLGVTLAHRRSIATSTTTPPIDTSHESPDDHDAAFGGREHSRARGYWPAGRARAERPARVIVALPRTASPS
jgi:hypothetical protein